MFTAYVSRTVWWSVLNVSGTVTDLARTERLLRTIESHADRVDWLCGFALKVLYRFGEVESKPGGLALWLLLDLLL